MISDDDLEDAIEAACKSVYAHQDGYWPAESERRRIGFALMPLLVEVERLRGQVAALTKAGNAVHDRLTYFHEPNCAAVVAWRSLVEETGEDG